MLDTYLDRVTFIGNTLSNNFNDCSPALYIVRFQTRFSALFLAMFRIPCVSWKHCSSCIHQDVACNNRGERLKKERKPLKSPRRPSLNRVHAREHLTYVPCETNCSKDGKLGNRVRERRVMTIGEPSSLLSFLLAND